MPFEVEVQHHAKRIDMVVDTFSRFPSAYMDDTDLDEEILKCSIEFVNNVFTIKKNLNTNSNAEGMTVDGLLRPTIIDLLLEQCNDALCRKYPTRLVETHSPYLLNEHEILSERSLLDGVLRHIILTKFRHAILYNTRCPMPDGYRGGRRLYDNMR